MPGLRHTRPEVAGATWRRALSRTIVVVLLIGFTCLYRFNTLGGRFAGFDNDHFVPFAYAKQVQAGDQPLRDFSGLGLQGAWPSLTYEVSALGQEWLGNNLRSEAIVTVSAVALAAALTFAAASMLSNAFWGVLATAVTTLPATAPSTCRRRQYCAMVNAAADRISTFG